VIPDNKIQEIVDATDIVELVGEFIELKKKGKNYMGLCPFHEDHTPSFSVSPEKKIAKCMTCKEGGNPINFLRKIKNISFDQAAKELANRYNIALDIDYQQNNQNYHYYKIMNEASKFYQDYLYNTQDGKVALDYLYQRGMTDDLIKKFQIGLAPKEKDSLYQYLIAKKYSALDLEDLGLIGHSGDYYYDIFSNRVTFPIVDANNNTLGFSARIYYQSTDPRYINTGDTKIFNKGQVLYNLNNATREVRLKKYVILCEGQMDAITLTKYNFPNVVCSLGTALTKEQVALIKQMTTNIFIIYDGDKAGLDATKKAFELFKGTKTYSLILPNNLDPDDFLKKYGEDALKKLIKESSKNRFDFLFELAFYGKDPSDIYQKNDIKKEVFSFLKEEKEMSIVETYLKKLSDLLGLSYEAIFNDYNLSLRNKKNKQEEEIIKKDSTKNKPTKAELMYLALIIFKKDYFDYFNKKLDDISLYITSDFVIDVYMNVSYFYSNEEENTGKLIAYINQEIKEEYIKEVFDNLTDLSKYSDEEIEKLIADLVIRFNQVKYKLKMKNVALKNQNNIEDIQAKLQEMLQIAREKKKEGI